MARALSRRVLRLATPPPIRDRLTAAGVSTLSDGELTALVLSFSSAEGQWLVDRFGGALKLARAGLGELCGLGQLSAARACRLKAALELGRRAVDEPLERGAGLGSSAEVEARMRGMLVGKEHEELHALGLDPHNRLVAHVLAATGAANLVFCAPRDVFRPLVREGAQGLILVHNHPTGSIEPSNSDAELTARFARAGAMLGMPLVDHVILGRLGRYSFAEHHRIAKVPAG